MAGLYLLIIAFSVLSIWAGPLTAASPPGIDDARLKHIVVRMKELVDSGRIGSALTLVARHGVYNGNRILSKSTVELMTQVHTGALPAGDEPGTGYGFGWEIVRDPLGSAFLEGESIGSYWHAGSFGTYAWVDPSKDRVGIFLV